jgi:hypothetical protein
LLFCLIQFKLGVNCRQAHLLDNFPFIFDCFIDSSQGEDWKFGIHWPLMLSWNVKWVIGKIQPTLTAFFQCNLILMSSQFLGNKWCLTWSGQLRDETNLTCNVHMEGKVSFRLNIDNGYSLLKIMFVCLMAWRISSD